MAHAEVHGSMLRSGPPLHRRPLWLTGCLAVLLGCYAWLYHPLTSHSGPSVQLRFTLFPFILIAYFAAVWAASRSDRDASGSRVEIWVVLAGAVMLRAIPLLGTVPVNPDLGRHLWEGNVFLEGYNPYAAPPRSHVYDRVRDELEARGDRLYSGQWLQYAGIRSTYGPVATVLFALPHVLPWDRLISLRTLMTAFDLLTVLALLGVTQALGRPPISILVYAWSPVCINGFADRGQVDAAMTFFMVLALLLVVRRRPAWGGAAFAASALVKVSPLLLLFPLLRAGGLPLGLAFAGTFMLGLLPFAGAGIDGLRGLAAFARGWRRNDSMYSIVLWLMGPFEALVEPQLLARTLVAVAALAYAAAVAVRMKRDDRLGLVRAMAGISAAVIVLSPVTFPWYAAPLVALLCFVPRASMLALSVVPMFWYLRFLKPCGVPFWDAIAAAGNRWRQPWRLPVYAAVTGLWLRERLARRRRGPGAESPGQTTVCAVSCPQEETRNHDADT